MKVECQNCQAKLSVPEDKVVPGQEFAFTCPKCHTKNTVQIPASSQEAGPAESPAAGPEPSELFDLGEEEEGAAAEFYEEGARLALICFDEGPLRDRLVQIMTDLDFVPVIPSSARDALKRMRLTQFQAVLLHESFDGQSREGHPVLKHIQPMNMTTRRRMFVALFGENYKTLDHMTAFALSVNAVVNLKDEAEFDKVLHKGLAEHERFYKVFFDVLRELGKA